MCHCTATPGGQCVPWDTGAQVTLKASLPLVLQLVSSSKTKPQLCSLSHSGSFLNLRMVWGTPKLAVGVRVRADASVR